MRRPICPIHREPDCSPLLNGCTWLTAPERHLEAHEQARVSIEKENDKPRTRMKVVRCTAEGCIWGTRSGKSDKAIREAHRQHMIMVAILRDRVWESADA